MLLYEYALAAALLAVRALNIIYLYYKGLYSTVADSGGVSDGSVLSNVVPTVGEDVTIIQ